MALTTLLDDYLLDSMWLLLPLTEDNLYKITALGQAFNANGQAINRRYEIGQFDENGTAFNLRSIRAEAFPQVFSLPKPEFFNQQRLGIRLANSSVQFKIKVESDFMAVFNTGSTTASGVAKTTVVGAIAAFDILPVNPNRISAIIRNNTNRELSIEFGAAATTANFTIKVPVGSFYEMPDPFTGLISGICSGVAAGLTGSVAVTEFVQ